MKEKATFAAGCFWGVEAAFSELPGVLSTRVGYIGGHVEKPSYEDVCTDETGHAEAVEIEFDPTQITFEKLLGVFWSNHDPTTLNRQGPDMGTQYRSAVFFHNENQRHAVEESIKRLTEEKRFRRPIVTRLEPATEFYPAEEYHQKYLKKKGLSHCHI